MNGNNVVKTTSGGGLSAGFVLFVVFLILKLTHVIDWNWFWIFFPLWIGPAILFTFVIVFSVILALTDRW